MTIPTFIFFLFGASPLSDNGTTRLLDMGSLQLGNTGLPFQNHLSKRRVMIGIAELVYSILILNFFFLEVYVTGFIPYIGKALSFLLLSWMYAYYCFEYKWNLLGVSLDKRLDFFECNWAFFAGFGNPCVLAIFFFSPLVSYGIMAILFPLQQAQMLTKILLLKEENGGVRD
ncbi:unnamed protein product [Ilex paraguariensis]|uniref:Uncharacterized protein n=1 Tax=Ilex paraguariensis TaxID=185542 RepID=A0ABC8TFU4_9AQUA